MQGFGGEGAGGVDRAGVFVGPGVEAGGGEGLLLATDALLRGLRNLDKLSS